MLLEGVKENVWQFPGVDSLSNNEIEVKKHIKRGRGKRGAAFSEHGAAMVSTF